MIEARTRTYPFLEGGGEMGKLTRTFDWAQTPVGPVEDWPQSLRTAIDIILHAEIPMLLWWGNELTQFYNDSYRPILGRNGKHPAALGQQGKECWAEIWPTIQPLIERVQHGGAIWRVDELIPISRNGRIEDVYWTFSYSPIRDEAGNIAGVLVVCNETTQQVLTLERIEESERTMRSIFLHAPVAICILDADLMRVEVVNDLFVELTGKTREELYVQSWWDVFPELREQYAHFLESVIITGIPYKEKELKLTLYRNGVPDTLYLDFVIQPLKSARKFLSRKVMILAINVTDKVLSRMLIGESERRYRTLITESTVAIALYTGPELRIQYVNEIMTGYWGKDLSVTGKTLREAVPELSGQRFLGLLEHVYKSGETYVGKEEQAMLEVNGRLRTFYFNYVYKPLLNAEGKIYGIHHMAMDVTDQVAARNKVERSEAILRSIILKAPVAMCILRGPQFIVEIANDRMFRLWGKDSSDLLNKPIFEGLHEARHQGFEEILTRVYATGESFSAEAVPIALPRDGQTEIIFVNFLYDAFREVDGTISGVVAVAIDVTEQVKARQRVEELVSARTEQLAESNRNLQRSNDELAQFAYIASHDLQEPARKIRTFVDMLQKNLGDIDPRSRNLLNKIEGASSRMLTLIRDILAYSQLSKEKEIIDRIDLNEVLSTVREDFELLIDEKKAVIESDSLPVINGIPVQINQLFGNLVSNALKFSCPDRTPRVTITCTLTSPEKVISHPELKPELTYYTISFRDNGIGFNQRNVRQIFDIFQRLHSKPEYQGTGIGLAMCKKIAQNHHGDIVAESTEGSGSTFHVYLPRPLP